MIQIPLTRAQYTSKAAEIKAQYGVEIAGDSGQIEHNGYTLRYAYDGTNLDLTVVHKPALVLESLVEHEIRGWFAA